ncbi:hypothetical protein ACNO5E_08850, partial [Vibrio parahaemolyticus]
MKLTVNKWCSLLIQYEMENGNLDKTDLWQRLSSDYQVKIKSLLKQFCESGSGTLTGNFADWLSVSTYLTTVKSKELKAGSYRAFRAALKKVLNYGLEHELVDTTVLKETISVLHSTSGLSAQQAKESSVGSTSAKKAKTIKPEEIYALRLYANNSLSNTSQFVIDWLEFCVITNCRPNETLDANLIMPSQSGAEHPYLKVRNTIKSEETKKAIKEGRLDTHRYIPLDNCSHHDLIWLSDFLKSFQSSTNETNYETVYSTSRSQLARMSETVLGKKVSLYVGRTQWAANQKAVLTSKDDIATYMGHTDTGQAERSYGRKSQGWQKVALRNKKSEPEKFEEG